MTRAAFEQIVSERTPPYISRIIIPLIRPSIRVIPGPPDPLRPLGSRLGGIPHVPADWTWPSSYEGEPYRFVGQIDCCDVAGLDGAEALPKDGLLAFFVDRETSNGSDHLDPPDAGLVQYWPAGTPLTPATVPEAEWDLGMEANLTFAEHWNVPDPASCSLRNYDFGHNGGDVYRDALTPPDLLDPDRLVSRMFGWPDLEQDDLDGGIWAGTYDPLSLQLLLQVDAYKNGSGNWEAWGPGGKLLFMMEEEDLRAHRWDQAIMFAQLT